MKQYGLIEPSIVECRRAKSYVMFHNIASVVFAVIAIIVGIAAKSFGIAFALLVVDAIQAACYYLSVRTTVLGVSRHFVCGHLGVLFERRFICPMNQIIGITRHSSFIERIFGATTIVVSFPGHFPCRYGGMEVTSVDKLMQIYQKYVILAERNGNPPTNP